MSDGPTDRDSRSDSPGEEQFSTADSGAESPAAESGDENPGGESATPEASGTSDDSASGDILPNRMLGEFRILRRLGRGGMAEVFLAEQTSLKRPVAIKILREEMLSDSDDILLRRFEQEAKAAAALAHSHIVQVYAIGHEEGVHYIVQEYVQGQNLAEFLKRKGAPDVPVALHLMRQVAMALQVAGDAGIVHRDIKPENIMITRRGEVKVADFGLAQLTQGGERVNLTQVGMTMGTPLYMSPEQVNGQPVDHRSDLYSLGVTSYHMLAGKPPFRGETALSVAVQHLKADPEPLAGLRSDLPPALCQVVHRLMAKEPADRYPSAQAVVQDLRKISQALKNDPEEAARLSLDQVSRPEPATADSSRGRAWTTKQHVAWFVVAAILVGGASAALGWQLRPGDPFESGVPATPRIPILQSARDQYARAMALVAPTADAWRTVIDNFPSPDDSYFRERARAQLAMLYLREGRHAAAEEQFTQLAESNEGDPEMAAVGWAGKAVLACIHGEHRQSDEIIAYHLTSLTRHLAGNSEMQRLLRESIRRNRDALGDVSKDYTGLFGDENSEGIVEGFEPPPE